MAYYCPAVYCLDYVSGIKHFGSDIFRFLLFADTEKIVSLPEKWHFQFDAEDRGLTAGWHEQVSFDSWPKMRIDKHWTMQDEPRLGVAWYAVSFNSLVYFENGAVGILLANWRTGKRTFRFEFHSAGATAFAEIDGEGKVWMDNEAEPVFSAGYAEFANSDESYINQGFWAENRAFINAVKSGQRLHNSLQDAVKTMQLADMIYEQAIVSI